MTQRGVYEEEIAAPGERWFKVVTSSGKVGTVHLPAELVDEAMMENLWRRLDRHDPAVKLKIVS
jgi:hypothetical protein